MLCVLTEHLRCGTLLYFLPQRVPHHSFYYYSCGSRTTCPAKDVEWRDHYSGGLDAASTLTVNWLQPESAGFGCYSAHLKSQQVKRAAAAGTEPASQADG